MLDQDTAKALLTVADETGVRVALVGDRHQLPAVGRGGVLDLAAIWVTPQAHVDLDIVHRFTDPEYAAISQALRTGAPMYVVSDGVTGEMHSAQTGQVWDALCRRNQVRIYPSEAERTQALAQLAADNLSIGRRDAAGTLMMADTREQAAALNGAIRDRLIADGHVDDSHTTITQAGERVGVGDRVATRRNDRHLGVTNRQTWTVTAVDADGTLTIRGRWDSEVRTIPAGYVREHVELAYATTVYGAQGDTTSTGHLVLGEHTSAASAYVAMTRGRDHNVVHIVADDAAAARKQWDDVFGRDRADLGPAVAAQRVSEDIDRYGTQLPVRRLEDVLADLRAAWTDQADLTDLTDHQQRLVVERDALQQVAVIRDRFAPAQQRLHAEQSTAEKSLRAAQDRGAHLDTTLKKKTADLRTQLAALWRQELPLAQQAAAVLDQGAGRFGHRRHQVHNATDELTAFAVRWRPVHPDLPTDPAQVAQQLRWLHGQRTEQQINTYAARSVTAAHPEAEAARQAEQTAGAAFEAAQKARRRLDSTLHAELRPYGRIAHLPDRAQRLTTLADQLSAVEHNLTTATTRLDRLQNEPTSRDLPAASLDTEHSKWAADRNDQRQTAAREAQARWLRQQQTHQTPPTRPGYPALDRGPGIGR